MGHTGCQKAHHTGLASSKVQQVTSSRHLNACSIHPVQQILGPKKIAEHVAVARERRNARLNGELYYSTLISDNTKIWHA